MESIDVVRLIGKAAWEKKGVDIVALDVTELVYYSDFFLIASGRSDVHVKALFRHIQTELAQTGIAPISIEGQDHCRWVLMDFGVVIVHLFYEPLREVYDLERLWGDAPRADLKLPENPPPSGDGPGAQEPA